MASLANDPGGTRRILVMVDGQRKTVRLGKMPKKKAERALQHIEELVACRIDGSAPHDEASRWLAGLADVIRERLVKAGLASPRQGVRSLTVGQLIKQYETQKFSGYKPGTIQVHDRAFASMREHLGADTPIAEVTAGDAEGFRDSMLNDDGLAEATVRKRCAIASKLFRYAIKHRLIDRDPFEEGEVPRANVGTSHHRYINAETARLVMEKLPSAEWKALFAMSRWGGVRVGSEPRLLTWADIDWERERIRVTSPKTERYAGRGTRTIPLFPELREVLTEWQELAPELEPLVFPMLVGVTDQSLRKTMFRAISLAGVEPWPKLFHNLRATRQTELEGSFPSHVVCSWLGNTKATADKHYLMVTDDHFAQAATKAAHNAAQMAAAASSVELQTV
jgi:integrase